MKCLACNETIAIRGFQDVFRWRPPLLCHRCDSQLLKGSGTQLFLETPWLRQQLERLDKGDTDLSAILVPVIAKTLKEPLKRGEIRASDPPWLKKIIDGLQPVTDPPKTMTISVDNPQTDFTIV